jgi:elongation factor P--beta-lysine ligase
MAQNQKHIYNLRKSFDYLLERNQEVQNYVKIAFRLEDYYKARKTIKKYVKEVDQFINKSISMAHKYEEKGNYEDQHICLKIVNMAENIIKAHLEVEKNILNKYIKKNEK